MLRRFHFLTFSRFNTSHQLVVSPALLFVGNKYFTSTEKPLFSISSPSNDIQQPAFMSKLREQQESQKVCFQFPSIMSMEDFLAEISKFKTFASQQMKQRIVKNKNNRQRSENESKLSLIEKIDLEELADEISHKMRQGSIKNFLVKEKIWDLKLERLPLIPYQIARRMILEAISDKTIRNHFAEHDCKYVEYDLFAQPKHFAKSSSATNHAPHRIPCVAIMGHINHGKTTLLDSLQQSSIVETEPGLITQSIRAFTIHVGNNNHNTAENDNSSTANPNSASASSTKTLESDAKKSHLPKKKKKRRSLSSSSSSANSPFKTFFENNQNNNNGIDHEGNNDLSKESQTLWKQINQITFIDTPGHRIFAEMRLHGSRLADVILLLISLEEGVLGQTEEIVRTALHFNKPLVIGFSKVDLFTDPLLLSRRLTQISNELRMLGVLVRFVDGDNQLEKILGKLRDPYYLLNTADNKYEATSTQKTKNEQEKQRMQNPNGVIETKLDENGNEIGKNAEQNNSNNNNNNNNNQRQAIAICLSASKGINVSLLIHTLQRISGHESLPKASPSSNPAQAVVLESFRDFSSSSSSSASENKQTNNVIMKPNNPAGHHHNSNHSTSKKEGHVNIVALIRNGTLEIGTPFVCDMGYGVIERITNTWGDNLLSSSSSASSSSSHLVLDEDVAQESLLPGAAVVIFGSKDTTCPGPLTHVISVESLEKAELVSKFRNRQRFFIERHSSLVHLLRPENKPSQFLHVGNYGQSEPELSFDYNVLVKEAKTPEVKESPLEAQWRANQLKPDEQPKNEEEYSQLVKNSKVLTVLVKVDGYNNARTAMREIPRLMTKNVVLNVVSVGFGPVTQKDVEKFGTVNVIVSFRAPRLQDSQAHLVMEMRKIKYGEFDVYSDMLEWLKKIVLDAQSVESAKRNPETSANREAHLAVLRAAGFLDEKKARMRTAQQVTPSLEQRLERKPETSRKDRFLT